MILNYATFDWTDARQKVLTAGSITEAEARKLIREK